MKTKEENPTGLHLKYYVTKSNSNELDPGFEGFMLRLDDGGDPEHVKASRAALLCYADNIEHYLPDLASDIRNTYRS